MNQSLNQSQLDISQQREAANAAAQIHKKQSNSINKNNQNTSSISHIIVNNAAATNVNPQPKDKNLML